MWRHRGSTDIFCYLKRVANVFVGILMSQNFQFIKVYTKYINPYAVATFFINNNYLSVMSHIATFG